MKKLRLFLSVLAITLLMCLACNAQNVKVKIAPFYTQIENVSVDNRYVQFPLITYKDITYFPMTHDLCAMLGLSTGFDSEKGLYITKHYYDMAERTPDLFGGSATNYYNTEYPAVIPSYPVYLNGIKIDNTKEEYPLINFRDITYFPMTWRFAYEELNFNIDFSLEDYSFILTKNSTPSMAYLYKADENSLYLEDKIDVYEERPNEYGGMSYHLLYSYWDFYQVNLETQMVSKSESESNGKKVEYNGFRIGTMETNVFELSAKEDGIYLDEALVMECNTENISDIQASEYKTGDNSSLIYLVVYKGQIVPPYAHHNEYIIERVGDKFTRLDWDVKNNFSGVYSDDNGGFYVCSSGYSPNNMGRWSNPFSDVYYYKQGSGKLVSYAEKYSDIINSAEVIGKAGGKLYVKAIWYGATKDTIGSMGFNIAPVNSGFYEINLDSGEMTKLYPYIDGETFIAPNGDVYCNAGYARNQRLINVTTGTIIPIE